MIAVDVLNGSIAEKAEEQQHTQPDWHTHVTPSTVICGSQYLQNSCTFSNSVAQTYGALQLSARSMPACDGGEDAMVR